MGLPKVFSVTQTSGRVKSKPCYPEQPQTSATASIARACLSNGTTRSPVAQLNSVNGPTQFVLNKQAHHGSTLVFIFTQTKGRMKNKDKQGHKSTRRGTVRDPEGTSTPVKENNNSPTQPKNVPEVLSRIRIRRTQPQSTSRTTMVADFFGCISIITNLRQAP